MRSIPSNIVIKEADKKPTSPWLYALILVLTGGGYFLWNNARKNAAAQQSAAALQGDIFTRQAAMIRNAISGVGTDEEALFEVAKQITDWPKVVKAYSELTKGGNIEADLSADLSADEYNLFMDYLQYMGRAAGSGGSGSAKAQVFIKTSNAPSNLPIGSTVYLNWNSSLQGQITSVKVYADPGDYPLKPLYTVPRPIDTTPKTFGKVVQFKDVEYSNSSTKVKLVQVHNGQRLVWVRVFDIGKFYTPVKGLASVPKIQFA